MRTIMIMMTMLMLIVICKERMIKKEKQHLLQAHNHVVAQNIATSHVLHVNGCDH